jgi:hypothetical protein
MADGAVLAVVMAAVPCSPPLGCPRARGVDVSATDELRRISGFSSVDAATATKALFIRLIIRLFQLVFSAETVFFSHNKSTNNVFQPAYQHSRTAPKM